MHRLALVVALGAIALVAAPAANAAQRAVAFTLAGSATTVTSIDLGATGASPGDLTVFGGTVTQPSGATGTVSGTSITMTAGGSTQIASSSITYQLPEGQIVVGGLAQRLANPAGLRRGVAFTRPVLGGTGSFLGAHGSVTQLQKPTGGYVARFSMKVPPATPVTTVAVGGQAAPPVRIDLGPTGASAGDITVIAAPLSNALGTPVGRLRGIQTAISTNGVQNVVQGQLTFALDDGEIVVGGVSEQVTSGSGLVPGTAFSRPILGGTGRYAGAGGIATSSTDNGVYTARLDVIGAGASTIGHTVRFVSRVPQVDTIDLTQPGKTPGDIYVVNADLADASNKAKIGVLRGTQTSIATDAGAETVQASFTFSLPYGQVFVAGLSQFPLDANHLISDTPYVRSVLGGTGRYEGAHGTLTSTRRADGTFEQVLRFVR